MTKEELIIILSDLGISKDYEHPATKEQLDRMSLNELKLIYNSIQWENNLVDVSRVRGNMLDINDDYTYLLTYSFPCQDLSNAGLRKGMKRDSNTRSGLLWQVERMLFECNEVGHLPHILLMENVPQVVGEANLDDFKEWMLQLERLGYSNYWKILNAKDYGIPQSRSRCFMVSILGEYNYKFPMPTELKIHLSDIKETKVDDKYYLSNEMISYLTGVNQKKSKFDRGSVVLNKLKQIIEDDICPTITCKCGNRPTDGFIVEEDLTPEEVFKVMVAIAKQKTNNVVTLGNYSPSGHNAATIVASGGVAPTVMCNHGTVTAIVEVTPKLLIRKLTPYECFILMGFDKEDYLRAKEVLTDGWLLHVCGDSIVVNVLMAIFGEMI